MLCSAPLLRREGEKGYVARPLDGQGQLALVLCAGPEHPPGKHLAALGDEGGQELHVLVVDVVDLVRAELADLAPAEEVALALVLPPAAARATARGPRSPTPAAPAPAAAVAEAARAHCCTSSWTGEVRSDIRPRRFSSSAVRLALRRSALRRSSSTRTVRKRTTPSVTRRRRSTSLTRVCPPSVTMRTYEPSRCLPTG